MIDILKLKRYNIVLTVNMNDNPNNLIWIPRIFLEYDGHYLKFTDLEIPRHWMIVKEFDKDLAYEKYVKENIPVLPNKDDIVYVSNCDYAFNPKLSTNEWVVRKFSYTENNKFITYDNAMKSEKWDYLIPYFDNFKDKMDLNNILVIENNKLSYASINIEI